VFSKQIDTVLFAASVLASDVAAGLAARLDAGLNWDLVDLEQQDGQLVGKRPALEDSVYVDVGWTSEPRLALFRPGTFDPVESGGQAEVEQISPEFEVFSLRATMLEQAHEESEGPSIEDADVIVAGGRGLGGPENFALVEGLAKALGGAVAATRAVVDAGWYPYAAQVGQTGKTVSPKLYIACGISGAIQHKVGMQGAGVVVAINKDPNAPIFEFSDLGVVGDLHEIVPKLTELVEQRKAA
jgi:electron transfer flavoprotein alpha subunit